MILQVTKLWLMTGGADVEIAIPGLLLKINKKKLGIQARKALIMNKLHGEIKVSKSIPVAFLDNWYSLKQNLFAHQPYNTRKTSPLRYSPSL